MTNRQAAIKIIRVLRSDGFEALLAGGCVRDMLLGRSASDYDVATNARPEEVTRMFSRTLKVGAKFGVVIVLIEGRQVEVATFRTETGYADGRHPAKVEFTGAAEDAGRRDFTINGMFYDPLEQKVIDYVNGQSDLKKKLIRTIGKPKERFGEDYLRMLRAVRFSTQLGFAIEPKTFSAIRKNAKNITKISGERISMELEVVLVNPDRSAGAALLDKSGLTEEIFPGLSSKQIKSGIRMLSRLPKKSNFALSITSFFADCSTEFALDKCKILKLSRNQMKHIKFLLANRGKLLNDKMSLAELKMVLAEPYFRDLYELQRAIQKSRQKSIVPLVNLRKRIKTLKGVELKPQPLLDGYELIRLGAVPGPTLGRLAEEMYIAQLEGSLQKKEEAKKWVQKWLQRCKMAEK